MIEKSYEKIIWGRRLRGKGRKRVRRLNMLNLLTLNEDYTVLGISSFVSAVIVTQGKVFIIKPSDNSILATLDEGEIYRSSTDFKIRPVDIIGAKVVIALFPY